jgi:hypothetical protein
MEILMGFSSDSSNREEVGKYQCTLCLGDSGANVHIANKQLAFFFGTKRFCF